MRKLIHLLPVAVLALSTLAGLTADPPRETPKLDPNLPYQAVRKNPVTYEVDFSAVVTPPYHTKTLKVWVPLPQSDVGQEVIESGLSTFPEQVTPKFATEPVYGNRFAYYEFDHPEGAQIIRHRFKITVYELHWGVEPDKVVSVTEWPKGFEHYLTGDKSVVVDDRFREAVREIVPELKGAGQDLHAVMAWVNKTMKYDHHTASLRASSEHALEKKVGHCSDYHGLCAAFGRTLNSPTRVTYGINTFPKNSPSHCKLEAYLPPYGWVSFDVSETQRLVAAIAKDDKLTAQQKEELTRAANDRLFHGFRDNTWILLTRGTDYELAPPAKKRAPVVRTIYAEADGEALPEPDPADPTKREFGWMTVHKYTADRQVPYPFKDIQTLLKK